jgi:hypothetical protein
MTADIEPLLGADLRLEPAGGRFTELEADA